MSTTLQRLTANYHLEPGWSERPRPVPAQIGGVARAAEPCLLAYQRR